MDENYQGGQHKKKMKKVSAKYLAHMLKGTAKGTRDPRTECFCWDVRRRILLLGAGQGVAKDNFLEGVSGQILRSRVRGSNSAGWGKAMQKHSRSGAWPKEGEPIKKWQWLFEQPVCWKFYWARDFFFRAGQGGAWIPGLFEVDYQPSFHHKVASRDIFCNFRSQPPEVGELVVGGNETISEFDV